jgi:DNA-binding ferritin-like protein (Dps family)
VELIFNELQNVFNKLYLQFLDFILSYLTDLNKEMKAEKSKIYLLYSKVESVYKSILEMFMKKGSVERANQEVKETILNLIKNQRDDSSREIFKRISDVRDLVPMSGSYLPQSLSVKVTQRFVGNSNSLKYTTK